MRTLRQMKPAKPAAFGRPATAPALLLATIVGSGAELPTVPFQAFGPGRLVALQPTESQPPPEQSPPRGDAKPAAGPTPDQRTPKEGTGLEPFRPSEQVPAGSGVSFPADI